MKKILAVITMAILFTACGSEDANADENYLDSVRSFDSELYTVNDELLIELGNTICRGLDRGVSLSEIQGAALDSGLDYEWAKGISTAAVNIYCPEHKDKINSFA